MKPLIIATSCGFTGTPPPSLRLSYWTSWGAMKVITRFSASTARLGSRSPRTVEATSMATAISGPSPSIELKLRSAARLNVFVSKKVVAEMETTLSSA